MGMPTVSQQPYWTAEMVREAQARLSTAVGADRIDAVAIGSPHLSAAEFALLERLIAESTQR